MSHTMAVEVAVAVDIIIQIIIIQNMAVEVEVDTITPNTMDAINILVVTGAAAPAIWYPNVFDTMFACCFLSTHKQWKFSEELHKNCEELIEVKWLIF